MQTMLYSKQLKQLKQLKIIKIIINYFYNTTYGFTA